MNFNWSMSKTDWKLRKMFTRLTFNFFYSFIEWPNLPISQINIKHIKFSTINNTRYMQNSYIACFIFIMKQLDLIKHYAKYHKILSSLKWNHNAGNSRRFSYRFLFNRSIAFWRLYVVICDEKQYHNSDFSNYCFS